MCIKYECKIFYILFAIVFIAVATVVPTVVVNKQSSFKTVVIDAGHGGLDGGVSSPNGVKESDLVLMIALALGEYLEGGGFNVVYTRKNQSALVGGKFVKKTDMKKRVEIIKKAKADAVVSLHLNSFSDKKRKGIQVFFGRENSRNFASLTQGLLNEKFNMPNAGRNFSILRADKYILNESRCPAIIIECGFLSNAEDEQNLLDDGYRHRLAQGIYDAILLWAFGEGA